MTCQLQLLTILFFINGIHGLHIINPFGHTKGGTVPYFPKIAYIFLTSHNFFSLSSGQIIIIPACCLLCVL